MTRSDFSPSSPSDHKLLQEEIVPLRDDTEDPDDMIFTKTHQMKQQADDNDADDKEVLPPNVTLTTMSTMLADHSAKVKNRKYSSVVTDQQTTLRSRRKEL